MLSAQEWAERAVVPKWDDLEASRKTSPAWAHRLNLVGPLTGRPMRWKFIHRSINYWHYERVVKARAAQEALRCGS